MLRNLKDAWGWIEKIVSRIERLESGANLENSSITNGRLRLIGGLLLIDSGGTLQVIGTVTGEGSFNWVGPWEFNSPTGGSIDGDVDLNGNFDLLGKLTSQGVRIEGGKIYAGTGANQVVIDGTTGKVTIGGLKIDPNDHDGMITLPNGGQVMANENATEVWSPGPARRGLSLTPSSINVFGANVASSTDGLEWLGVTVNGELKRVSPSVGGPGGELRWPFPESTVSSEYGPRESPGGIGSTFHEGIDFGIAEGTPIPAAGSGTIILAGDNGGYGNCVIIDHGNGLRTLYGHMRDTPSVSVGSTVARGQTIGLVGNTGQSYGAHLHLEVHVNGTPVNPRTKLKGS